MNTDKVTLLYDRTNGGLDIIKHYIPEATDKKKFKFRTSERTPSASVRKFGDVWKVKDFGDDRKALSPIDVAMEFEGKNFADTIAILCSRYGIDNSWTPPELKEEFRSRPKSAEDPDDLFTYEAKEFTDTDLMTLGPKVTADICRRYGLLSLKEYTFVSKDLQTVCTIRSTDHFPIFLLPVGNQCVKILKPKDTTGKNRFIHFGDRPQDYVFGLKEAKEAYQSRLKKLIEGQKEEEAKLPEVVICSGDRDALNVASMGAYPIWFNSEAEIMSNKVFSDLRSIADRVYNIPDIDKNGIKYGRAKALAHPQMYTAWLPDSLRETKDFRGKPSKDFRDWIGPAGRSSFDFKGLLINARSCLFYEWTMNDRGGRYEINPSNLIHFLQCSGFGVLKDEKTGDRKYVHIAENVVKEVDTDYVRRYLILYCRDKHINIDVENLLIKSSLVNDTVFSMLSLVTPSFVSATYNTQLLYFKNQIWEVSPTGVQTLRKDDMNSQVWEHKVLSFAPSRINPAFSASRNPETGIWSLTINDPSSHFFRYLMNTSRVHWRKEFETRIENYNGGLEEYRNKYKFSVFGELLNPDEQQEQAMHLLNKIFAIGYLLHRYKSPSRGWCVVAVDNTYRESNRSDGGTGKSFCFHALRPFLKADVINGKNMSEIKNNHVFERVDRNTEVVIFDDADYKFNFDFLYNLVTGSMNINPKNRSSFSLEFKESPKMILTTNHTFKMDGSTSRRILYTAFCDYYHEHTPEDDYLETRKIYDDFGYDLFDDRYSATFWNQDINFFADCLQFYLSTIEPNVQIQPPLQDVVNRTMRAQVGESVYDWAVTYFAPEMERLDRFLIQGQVYSDYVADTGDRTIPNQRFTRKLAQFAKVAPWIDCLNPDDLKNSAGRIIRRFEGNAKPALYMRSKKPQELSADDVDVSSETEDDNRLSDLTAQVPIQTRLHFDED